MFSRCNYLFQLRHYDSNEEAAVASTSFALWTMANDDYFGTRFTDMFIEVTAAHKQDYILYIGGLYDIIRRDGRIAPQVPPALQTLIDSGLDTKALIEKHAPLRPLQ